MYPFSIINRIIICLVCLLPLSQSALGQMEKIYPAWALTDGTQFVAKESGQTYAGGCAKLAFVYTGTSDFAFGFYSNNNTLNNLSGLRYGFRRFSTSFSIHADYGIVASVSEPLNIGDVLEVKYCNDIFTLSRNGTVIHTYQSGSIIIGPLYPYFWDISNSGLEGKMSFHREPYVQGTSWYSSGSWRVGKKVIRKGEDGGFQLQYDGSNRTYQMRWHVAKNVSYSYAIARMYFFPSSRRVYFYARNPQAGLVQNGSMHLSLIYLDPDEIYTGMTIRMAREGSNFVLYVNGEEKKRYHTDANYELHPVMYRYFSGQENQLFVTTTSNGGMCQNYFNTTPSYVNTNDAGVYYDEAAVNENHNYVTTRTYNGEGEGVCHLTGESRTYFDDMGREIQSQAKDVMTNKVWASETLYDKFGRRAITTLVAPTGYSNIRYKDNFVLDAQGNPYGHNDFEDGMLNNPNPVGKQSNTLGWWYSSNNDEEEWQATTDYPYTRLDYSKITYAVRRTSSPGNTHRMGSGHEVKSYTMPAGSELSYFFRDQHPLCLLAGNSDYDANNAIQSTCNTLSYTPRYLKTISEDADGKQSVAFTDGYGNTVARAISGNPLSSSSSNLRSTTITVAAGGYHDIHITRRSSHSTTVSFAGSGRQFSIYDLSTDQAVHSNSGASSHTLSAGFYRVENHNSTQPLTISYQLNYYNFSLDIYDFDNRNVASVAPRNVRYHLNTSPTSDHYAYSFVGYGEQGAVSFEDTPDRGRTDYYYNRRGELRFSVDAEQALNDEFNYVKYDAAGRILESGVFSGLPPGGLQYRVNQSYPSTPGTEVVNNLYDEADPAFSLSGYTQENTGGKLVKTWNDAETIWYSYDEVGRVDWIARQISGNLGIKVTEYTYDLLGNPTTVVYQDGETDEFRHHYAYDSRSRLVTTATRTAEHVSTSAINQLQNRYTPDGDLERRIIRGGLETQTFAYTIRDQLKAINPEDMRVTDIGGGVQRHPFSLALHYHRNDYEAANGELKEVYSLPTNSTTSSYNNYRGNITGARWKTRAAHGGTDYSGHFAYRYRYNDRNQFYQAYFGYITPYSDQTNEGRMSLVSDYYNYLTYDTNGNITRNIRRSTNIAACGSIYMDDLRYRYLTANGSNQLYRVDDYYTANCVPGELTDQNSTNYYYNAKGQLIKDLQENIYLDYDSRGRVLRVREGTLPHSPIRVEYTYGPDGKRVRKSVKNGSVTNDTWYAYDMGSLRAIYESSSVCTSCTPERVEVPLYAEGRIGVAYTTSTTTEYHYELTDHLGNVRAVITEGTYEEIEVISYADYYPQGWKLPGRNFTSSEVYRYGYQGQFAEQDAETGWNSFDLRAYDNRLGRWMTPDPYSEFHSPYVAMANDPINRYDPDGGRSSWKPPRWLVPIINPFVQL
ncbi:MAG: RHS repeat-associated core domain-containing protein, partial [Bacteroidota bacterium]